MSVDAIGWALKASGVSPRAKLVLIGLANSADETTWDCYPSRKTLARAGDCSDDTVDRALRELIDAGLIKKEMRTRKESRAQTSNLYTLNPSRISAAPSDVDAAPPAEETRPPPPHSYAAPPAASGAAPMNHQFNPQEKEVVSLRAREAALWQSRLDEARERAGAALNVTNAGTLHAADLRRLCRETANGPPPCDWDEDVLPAVDQAAAWVRGRGELMQSFACLENFALKNRDRRLAGLREVSHVSSSGGDRAAPRQSVQVRPGVRSASSVFKELADRARVVEARQREAGPAEPAYPRLARAE